MDDPVRARPLGSSCHEDAVDSWQRSQTVSSPLQSTVRRNGPRCTGSVNCQPAIPAHHPYPRRLRKNCASWMKDRLPTSPAHREHVDDGGLMSYGPTSNDMWRLAAATPAHLPVEQPTNSEVRLAR